jgi:hypothetical protein
MQSLEDTMKSGIQKLRTPAALFLAAILPWGLAHVSWADAVSHIPDPIAMASELIESAHRAVTNFNELSERMDPTCSECNQP